MAELGRMGSRWSILGLAPAQYDSSFSERSVWQVVYDMRDTEGRVPDAVQQVDKGVPAIIFETLRKSPMMNLAVDANASAYSEH